MRQKRYHDRRQRISEGWAGPSRKAHVLMHAHTYARTYASSGGVLWRCLFFSVCLLFDEGDVCFFLSFSSFLLGRWVDGMGLVVLGGV